jgi:hypothetical protein
MKGDIAQKNCKLFHNSFVKDIISWYNQMKWWRPDDRVGSEWCGLVLAGFSFLLV